MPDPTEQTNREASGSRGSRTVGIGILGTGIMGRKMTTALQQHPRFSEVTAWDPEANALQAALAQAAGVRTAARADRAGHAILNTPQSG